MRRRGTALVGIFAILLQAALFAWHHHPPSVSSHGAPAVFAGPIPGQSTPVLADDDCQICFALSHHSPAPIDFILLPPPREASSSDTRVEENLALVARYLHFRSRAPPRV